MSSSAEAAEAILALFADALDDQAVTARRMFGEYGCIATAGSLA